MTGLRWDVPDAMSLAELVDAPLPMGLRAGPTRLTFHRDLYFDTPEGDLRRRGVRCRVRFEVEDRRTLVLDVPGMARAESRVNELEPSLMFSGDAEPARRLRALADPARLVLDTTLEVERRAREALLPLLRLPQFVLAYDTVTAVGGSDPPTFHELSLWRRPWGAISQARFARAIEQRYALRRTSTDRAARAAELRALGSGDAAPPARQVALLAVAHGRLALSRSGATLRVSLEEGGGEEACRRAMRRLLGNVEGEVRLLGVVPAAQRRPAIEVWLVRRLRRDLTAIPPAKLQWFAPQDIIARVGSPVLRDPATLAALAVAARSELVPEWSAAPLDTGEQPVPVAGRRGGTTDETSRLTLSELRVPALPDKSLDAARPAADQFINALLSSLEFNARVLALAEDPRTPLAARLRFLAIFTTNLDQFFMVEVGALQHQVAAAPEARDRSPDGLTAAEQLDAIAIRVHPLVARQYRCYQTVAAAAAAEGTPIRAWRDLSATEREAIERRFVTEVAPLLTPKALTRAPGHPFPHLADRRLSLAVVLRDSAGGPAHYACVELPPSVARFVVLEGHGGVVPLEAVVRARLPGLFPGRDVLDAYAFRVTRTGDIQLDELGTASFAQAVAEEVRRRPWGPVVRIEVERAMPPGLRELLQRELRFEESDLLSALGPSDVYEAEDLMDLGALGQLAGPVAAPALDYPPLVPQDPFSGHRSIMTTLDRGDVLVHHPYDSFTATLERFIAEAADDPDVAAIKLTLYRPGGPSPIGDALRRAAARGADVSVFVELKARFDEELNIGWAQSLEAAGIHVITGLATLKIHAKIALVVRRAGAGSRTRRYAHVGSGNYNADTARLYTDVGLFTADERITEDLHALFNELTGSSRPPQAAFRRLLVAPTNMLDQLLALIAREGEHARAGRGGRIRAKLNGLADCTVIGALYRASQAGVEVELVVRGICMLRPGVPGLSERIRVVSVLGRFLEHCRIYHFANGGEPEYYVGSADWRPRNLRRRVEVVTPVDDPGARARLDAILERDLGDPEAWSLESDGSYTRAGAGVTV